MEKNVAEFLQKAGYTVNEAAQNVIRECDTWYRGEETDFHQRININGVKVILKTLNFAKRCCADDANLCELVEVNASENEAQFEAIKEILAANRFGVMYRKQLESMSASGTVGAYIRLDNAETFDDGSIRGGFIAINYCNAANIYPLTVINDEVIECAFYGESLYRTEDESTLVVFTKNELGRYVAETFYFKDEKEEIEKRSVIELGEVKPFSIMRTAEVNNRKNMEGYGYPKLYTSIPVLKALDLAYNILYGDLDKGEKLVFINELLSCIAVDNNGQHMLTPQQKEVFVLLGEKLPEQNSVIHEYNPELRIDAITKIFEMCLSLLSMSFGFGTKKYTFEGGQIKSATEYIGERQDSMQELNKQREEAAQYITDIVHAVKWFANEYNGGTFDIDEEVNIDFDDSYITDRATELERKRTDALSFDIPMLKVWYLMDAYNLAEDEAKKLVAEGNDLNMDDGGEKEDS